MHRFLLLIFLLLGCQGPSLSVFTEYVSIETLPSYRIRTPDPCQYYPDVGENLHIKWSVPSSNTYNQLELKVAIHFVNGKEDTVFLDLTSRTGIYVYPLLNEEYFEKGGIFSYQVELYGDDCLIQESTHQLWVETIQIPQSD